MLLSSTSMLASGIELLTSTGTLSSVLVAASVPAPTRDMFESVACLNLDKSAQQDGEQMMWVATPEASSMVAHGVDHRVQVVGDGAAVGR